MPTTRSIPAPTAKSWSRFAEKIQIDPVTGCWDWRRARLRNGYGRCTTLGKSSLLAHRVAYTWLIGPIPDDRTLDHLCRNRGCVNPDHLEAVTGAVNFIRGNAPGAKAMRTGMCKRGHPLTASNAFRTPSGRQCKICLATARSRLGPVEIERRRHLGGICKYGHEMTPENTRIVPNGSRQCRECCRRRRRASDRRRRDRRRLLQAGL